MPRARQKRHEIYNSIVVVVVIVVPTTVESDFNVVPFLHGAFSFIEDRASEMFAE